MAKKQWGRSIEEEYGWLKTVIHDRDGGVSMEDRLLELVYCGPHDLVALDAAGGNLVLSALLLCIMLDRPIPDHVKMDFCVRTARALFGRYESWGEAFGRVPLKRAPAMRHFRERFLGAEILKRVLQAHAQGEPIDNALFEKIGREVGSGGRETTRKAYASARKRAGLKRLP